MPQLAQAMALLKDVFDKHAGKDGTLSKQELNNLLHVEFGKPSVSRKDV